MASIKVRKLFSQGQTVRHFAAGVKAAHPVGISYRQPKALAAV